MHTYTNAQRYIDIYMYENISAASLAPNGEEKKEEKKAMIVPSLTFLEFRKFCK